MDRNKRKEIIMKRTDKNVLVCMTSTRPIYRRVFTDGEHFYVKWNGKQINVDKDIKDHNYITERSAP